MNVFVLCTGRCGSVTFARACSHFTNFTSGHETRSHCTGVERLHYPERHIEVDNRLSWFLGRLERAYGNDAYYVHLTRDPEAVARSFTKRINAVGGIARAYRNAIILNGRGRPPAPPLESMRDYVHTVTENIQLFLRDKRNVMTIRLEDIKCVFPEFCGWISAEGNLEEAIKEWDRKHNVGTDEVGVRTRLAGFMRRVRNW